MSKLEINTLSNAGLSVHYKTLQKYKKDIADAHLFKLNKYFNLNISFF